MFRKTASIFVAAIAACCALTVNADGFDGKTLVTNDWFDASFTSLTVDTVIATNTATGITFGAGTWTSAPTNGTAKIVADEDAGSGATMLAIDAPGEELTFTPAVIVSATGMETLSFDVCTEAVDELPTPDAQTQAAFTIYSDDGVTFALKGYVAGGWTNLEYTAGADTLTNVWLTLYLDFATVSSVRYVRFSVKPAAAASVTVLTDSEGTAWFPAAVPAATTVNSVSVTGTGSFRSFSGDSLAEVATDVASYNGINYASVADAVAAGEADSWAHGSVTLLANATWTPIAAGTYNIDVAAFTLDVTATEYTLTTDTVAGTVTATRIYTWAGSVDTWLSAANWTVGNDAHVATTYPGEVTTEPFTVVFTKNATFATAEVVTLGDMTVMADGYAVTLPSVSVSALYTENSNLRSACYTRIESGTVRCGNFPVHNIIVGEDAELVIDKAISVNFNYFAMFTGTGSITVDGVHLNASKNGNYGQVLKAFGGTFKMTNGAQLTTSSNSSQSSITGPGKFVFAGGSVVKGNSQSHTYANSSFDIVAGTVNVSEQSLPLNKVAIVSGNALDTAAQYVVMTANSVSGALADNAVDAALAADGWSVMQSTNGEAKAILVLTHNASYAWTGAAGDGLWATPENWLVGDYVPIAAPGEGDAVSITTAEESLEVVVTDGQNVGTLTKGENVSLVGPGPYSATVTEGVVSLVRVPSSFVWTNSDVSNWETLDNWTVNGRPTDVLPGGLDEVRFPSTLGNTAFVKYSTSQVVSNAVFDAEVTLRIVGTRHDYYIYAYDISGDGKLVLTNAAIASRGTTSASTNLTVGVDLEMAPASTNRLFCACGNIIVNGDVSGNGAVEASIYKQTYGPEFHGKNDGFMGEYWTTVNTGARRDCTHFADGGATSSNATWRVVGSDGNKVFFGAYNETYYFGALNGMVDNSNSSGSGYVNGCWAEVGALNIDCGFGGHYSRGYKDASHPYINHIRKVGTAKLTLTLSRPVGDIEIKGGTLDIGSKNSVPLYYTDAKQHYLKFLGDGATLAVSGTETVGETTAFVDPSARIAYSTAPICFSNAVNEVHTWATALASSNTDGLVKKGEGTLTLAAAPLYTGDTYLDGGTLKIPTSANKTVKTHVVGKSVRTGTETIGEVEYTVYTLGTKRPTLFMVY